MKRIGLIVLLLAVAAVSFGAGRTRWKYPWIEPAQLRGAHRVELVLAIEAKCLRKSFRHEELTVNGLNVVEMVGTPSPSHLHVGVRIVSKDGRTFGAEKKGSQARGEAFCRALVPEIEKRFCRVGPKQKYLRMQVFDNDTVALGWSGGIIRLGDAMLKPKANLDR